MFDSKPSAAQLNANRANAQKSTGPTSEEGKCKSRRNASRHHLTGQVMTMTDEDRTEYERFLKAFKADFHLTTALETTLCEQVAHGFFRLGRANGLEENYLSLQCDWKETDVKANHPEISNAMLQALNFFAHPEKFNLLTLYEQRIHRKTHKDLKILMDLQAKHEAEPKPQTHPEPEKVRAAGSTTNAESITSPEIGFVFSNAQEPEPQRPQPIEIDTKPPAGEPEIPKAA